MSGVLFQYPGAILMTAVGVLAAKKLESPQGWLEGIAAGMHRKSLKFLATAILKSPHRRNQPTDQVKLYV